MGFALKLTIKYLGPYRVTEAKECDRYSVEKIDGEGPSSTTVADSMKLWRGFSDDAEEPELFESDNKNSFEANDNQDSRDVEIDD